MDETDKHEPTPSKASDAPAPQEHQAPKRGMLIDGHVWTIENDTPEAEWFRVNKTATREEKLKVMMEHGKKGNFFKPIWDTRRNKTPLPGAAPDRQQEQYYEVERMDEASGSTKKGTLAVGIESGGESAE